MKKHFLFLILIFEVFSQQAKADEGMWLPILIQQLNIDDMRSKGFRLNADDIYSINKACIKDAVMIFGGGCTGEAISKDGLVLTNHHCGYDYIQRHSSIEKDYLTNGFWAMSRKEELPNPGLTVTFLRSMKEVSAEVLKGVTPDLSKKEQDSLIDNNRHAIIKEAVNGTTYKAEVKSFFNDNVYYLLIQEVYKDIRLVGAPPSSIGKFGGDTDNWMWPRHGADFSMFRIYSNSDNKPAQYSADNVPYHPKYSLPISTKGIHAGDFTFVLGYPGTTQEYAPAENIRMLTQTIYPKLIDVRTKKLDIITNAMDESAKLRIQYSAKAASISNAWKKWQGEIKGLNKLDAYNKKSTYEKGFYAWAKDKPEYDSILTKYKTLYSNYELYYLTTLYYRELIGNNGMELVTFSGKLESKLNNAINDSSLTDDFWKSLDQQVQNFYKDYDVSTDKKLTAMLISEAKNNIAVNFLPPLDNAYKRVFKSSFIKPFSILDYKSNPKYLLKKLEKDPACLFYKELTSKYDTNVKEKYISLKNQLSQLNQIYMKALMEFEPKRKFYPDANFTLRLSYGKIMGYEARDAVFYQSQTFLKGVMEKDNPSIYDYNVPMRLKDLYKQKDFGTYMQNGEIPICFIATNHTTGGNSGSPVLNANGELIGLNFDRAWEGVMSDLMYNPEQCRNISVDIRYILFLIDKYARAGYLLQEMDLR